MSNSRRLVSSTFYEPDDDDYYHEFENPDSSHNSSYTDMSSASDRAYFDSSASTIYPSSRNTLANPQRRVGGRSPRNQSLRSVSPKYPNDSRSVVLRPDNTKAPVRYGYNSGSVEDDEPIQTIHYNESTLITKGRNGVRIKKNTTQSHEYYVRNSDLC